MGDALRGFIHDLRRFYAERALDGPAMFATVAEELSTVLEGPVGSPSPDPLPVAGLLERLETDGEPDSLLTRFLDLAPHLPWTQTRAYLDTLPPEFVRNYGYVRLVGPAEGAVLHSDRVAVGVGVWGAGLHYPRHAHPAEEAYHVLAGDVGFRGADGTRVELVPVSPGDSPGEFAHNAPDEPHELWFGGRSGVPEPDPDLDPPCVLLWAWTGEIGVDARLV